MQTPTLTELDQEIRRLTREHPEARPFLCEGSPTGCEIILVGINPGTDTPFWPYWRLPYGCYKQEWLKDYLRRHGSFLPTRARIERLFEATAPLRCLETNVYFRYSPDENSLADEDRDTNVFDYLLRAISPKVMFIHGASAIAHVERLAAEGLRMDEFTRVCLGGVELDVLAGSHLSRGWSYERVDALAVKLKARCQGGTRNVELSSPGVENPTARFVLGGASAPDRTDSTAGHPKAPASRSQGEELIEVAEDCPVDHAVVPREGRPEKTRARVAYEILIGCPYRYAEIEFFHELDIVRRGRPNAKIGSYQIKRLPLVQSYGWGIHRNAEGKLALVPMEAPRYKELQRSVKRTRSYRKSRA